MTRFYFDVWAADDLLGTALGELTQAYQRTWQRVDQAIGTGQFTINRHDSQYVAGWCAQDNLVRVRLVAGGPFDADDERYVHAFFIEQGDDDAVSVDEEGGEEITRGGRDAVVILRRAVMSYEPDYVDDLVGTYTSKTLIDGNWHFKNRNAGSVLRICLRNATARTPNPLTPLTHDFNINHDSTGADWSDSDADWSIPVGQDLLEVLGTLASGDTYWRADPALVLHAYDEDPGVDRSASVAFVAGDNIRESAQRQVNARETISRVLVQGTKKDGKLTYRWVSSGSTETLLGGRREGFVEYQATPTPARLDKAGHRAIRSRLKQHDGPTTLGVEERAGDPIAFDDYFPGDSVTIDIPGIWDEVVSKVYAIQMDEDEAGDALVTVILEEQPFDPASGASSDAGLGDGSGSSKCGDCPPLPPHTPGTGSEPGDCATALPAATVVEISNHAFSAISVPITPTGESAILVGVQAANHNVPVDTDIVLSGVTQVVQANCPAGHPATGIGYVGGISGAHTVTGSYTGGFAAATDSKWAAVAAALPTTATAPVQAKAQTNLLAGDNLITLDAPPTPGNVLVLVISMRSGVPSDQGGQWTRIAYAEAFADFISTDSVSIWYRCVQPGDGSIYGNAGQARESSIWVSEWTVSSPIAIPPLDGQMHTEELTGDGSTTAFQTNYPYALNSLVGHVTVNGALWPVTETDPTTGTFTFASAPPAAAVIIVTYQNAGTTATGATNPIPPASTPTPGLTDPMTTRGDLIRRDASNVTARLGVGAAGKILTSDGTDVAWGNGPMTTQDDLIVGGASGAPGRLAKGSDGQVLTVDPTTHHLVWATPSSGFSNPMTTKGDLIVGDTGGSAIRKGVGSDGQVLTADAASTGGVKWATPTGGGGAISYPSLKPATPDDDFTTLSGWTAVSTSGSFTLGNTFGGALDGSHLWLPFYSQTGYIYKAAANANQDWIVGGFGANFPFSLSGDAFVGIALLDSSGDGVGLIYHGSDNTGALIAITAGIYNSSPAAQVTSINLGPTLGTPARVWLKLNRVSNTWLGFASLNGATWDVTTASMSRTITVSRKAIGIFGLIATTYKQQIVADWAHTV